MPLEFMLCSSQNLPGLHWKTHLILQFLCGFLEITIPIISLCSHRFALCWLYPISLFQTSCSVFAFVFPICLCLCISNFIYDVCSKLALSHFLFPNKLLSGFSNCSTQSVKRPEYTQTFLNLDKNINDICINNSCNATN